jgi:hypothetical protein
VLRGPYTLRSGTVNVGADNVLSILVSNVGHDQFVHFGGRLVIGPNSPKGLISVTTAPATPIAWKIQGNQGGEDISDTSRGPLNNGGLFGERAGWSLPGYHATDWAPVTLPNSDPAPGVAWYRTTFNLNEPRGVDASIGLNIADAATRRYRAVLFLNGWNLGLYANEVGPQHTFVLPNGLLHTGIDDDGRNTLAIAVLTPNARGGATGGGLGKVSLTDAGPGLGVVEGGVPMCDVPSRPPRRPGPRRHRAGDPGAQPRQRAVVRRVRPGRRQGLHCLDDGERELDGGRRDTSAAGSRRCR